MLLSGVVLLLVMLPFMFISLFYAPWLEARVRLRAPREVPEGTRGHVILTEYDAIAIGLIERLRTEHIPYYVIEPDPTTAARMIGEGISVIAGDNDSSATYQRTNATAARMLLANCEDTTNTNITITAREIAPDLPIAAIVEEEDSIDVLQLSGATTVLPLKHQLGEYLANRADTGGSDAHVIGAYRGLQIAELPARDTVLAGQTVRDTRLRERTGVSVVGLWERGKLRPAFPDSMIQPDGVIVLAGTESQIAALNALMPGDRQTPPPVLIIGAGKVGQAAARALKRKGVDGPRHRSRASSRSSRCAKTACRCSPATPQTARLLEQRRHPPRVVGPAHDQRRCDEHLPGGVLPPAEPVAAHRQPHHARTQRRSDSPGRRRLRPQLHDARRRVRAVAAARLRARGARRRRGAVLDRRARRRSSGRRLADSGIGSGTGMSVVALDRGGTLVTRLTGETAARDRARCCSCWAASSSGGSSRSCSNAWTSALRPAGRVTHHVDHNQQ